MIKNLYATPDQVIDSFLSTTEEAEKGETKGWGDMDGRFVVRYNEQTGYNLLFGKQEAYVGSFKTEGSARLAQKTLNELFPPSPFSAGSEKEEFKCKHLCTVIGIDDMKRCPDCGKVLDHA